jgi:WD40 repeat protein
VGVNPAQREATDHASRARLCPQQRSREIDAVAGQVGWGRALAENGAVLADAGAAGIVRLTDPRGPRVLRSIRTGINPIWDLAWSSDGSTLA